MSKYRPAFVIHGHFYQPPRENPWTGIVDREPSAAPFRDWNERIHQECYRRNSLARIVDELGRVERIVNNFAKMSFNIGPTLLRWMERHRPETLARIQEADRLSLRARGHGNAIAQGYNHAILPLCNDRDLRTQIRWGMAEFRHRFGREAESLWLPETACNDRVLGALIDEGLRYAILAPGQAAYVRPIGHEHWQDVTDGSVDPRRPYRYLHTDGSGRSMALFFYDGAISRAIAFEGLLGSSYDLVSRFERASAGPGSVVHAVTDGESYGHYFGGGERCLGYTLDVEAPRRGFWVTNYGELLDRLPPTDEAQVKAGEDGLGTAWSCAHGVGRWHRDCGCHTGGKPGWSQAWRTPLRDALNLLRDEAAEVFEEQGGELLRDPWATRDAYIELMVDPERDRASFLEPQARGRLDRARRVRVLELLEMQRSSLLMFTSCGWFFSDLSGIETVQILRYAGRLLDQLAELGHSGASNRFLEALAEARSNLPEKGNGADLFRREVQPVRVTTASLAAHIGISALPQDYPEQGELAGCRYELRTLSKGQRGRLKLATARVWLRRESTGPSASTPWRPFTSAAPTSSASCGPSSARRPLASRPRGCGPSSTRPRCSPSCGWPRRSSAPRNTA